MLNVKTMQSVLFFLLGAVSFINFGRVGPVVSFWQEWWSGLLVLVVLMASVWQARDGWLIVLRPVSALALCLLALLAVQWGLGLIHARAQTLMAAWVLVLVLVLDVCVAQWRETDVGWGWLDAWAYGLLLAFSYHLCLTVLGRYGYDFVYFQIRPMDVPERALGAFGQPNQLGVFSVLAILTAAYLFARRKFPVWAFGLVYIGAMVLVVMSFSRAALLCAGGLGIAALVRSRWVHRARQHTYRWLAVGFLGLCVAVAALQGFAQQWLGFHDVVTDDVMNREVSNASRVEQVRDGLSLGVEHPWFGVGFRNYAEARLLELKSPAVELNVSYPHNILIHLFAEFGGGGVLLVVGVSLWFFLRRRKAGHAQGDPDAGMLMGGWLLIMFLYSMVEFPLMYLFFLLPTLLFLSVTTRHIVCPVGQVRIARGGIIATLALWGGLLGGAAWDYRRIEPIHAALTSKEARGDGGRRAQLLRDVAHLSSSSLFQYQATTLWLFVGGMNPIFVDEKVVAARSVMVAVPSAKTIAQYVGFLLLARRDGEAVLLLTKLGSRNGALVDGVKNELRALARLSPDLTAAVRRAGLQQR